MWRWLTGQDAGSMSADELRASYLEACNLLDHGEVEPAAREFRRLTAREPRFAPAWFGLGRCCLLVHDVEGAISGFRHSARLDPGSWSVQHALGNALREAGRDREAERCYRRAASLAPGERAPLLALALHMAGNSRFGEARLRLEQALECPEGSVMDHELQTWLGVVCGDMGDPEAAERAFTRACLLAPDNAAVYDQWAGFAFERGEWEEAARLAARAVALDADLERAWVICVQAALRLEQGTAAEARIAQLETSARLPGLACALRSKLHLERGETGPAESECLRALAMPDLPPTIRDFSLQCLREVQNHSGLCDRFVITLAAHRTEGGYYRTFGILAPDESAAIRLASHVQERLDPGPIEVEEIQHMPLGEEAEVGIYEMSLSRRMLQPAAGPLLDP